MITLHVVKHKAVHFIYVFLFSLYPHLLYLACLSAERAVDPISPVDNKREQYHCMYITPVCII